MDSVTLEKLLKKDLDTSLFFHGVFSSDNLPTCTDVKVYT